MNIDFKLTAYRFIRNYILLSLFRYMSRKYNEWEKTIEKNNTPSKKLPLPGEIVPYNSAVNAISAIKIRGGNSNFPLLLAIFNLIYILKKYIIKYFPKSFVKLISSYKLLLDKYPKLKLLEDVLMLTLSIATTSISIRKKTINYVLSYDVVGDNREVDFIRIAADLGVNLDVCGFKNSILFEGIISRDVADYVKVDIFREWLKEFQLSSNSGDKQGLLLCLIAVLVYFFFLNYNLFIDLLRYLIAAVDEGIISETMRKVIIRRLKRKGVLIPSRYE